MIQITDMERVFKCSIEGQDLTLTDPNPEWSAETVMNFYSNSYPLLVSATLNGPRIIDDTVEYRFSTSIGSKG